MFTIYILYKFLPKRESTHENIQSCPSNEKREYNSVHDIVVDAVGPTSLLGCILETASAMYPILIIIYIKKTWHNTCILHVLRRHDPKYWPYIQNFKRIYSTKNMSEPSSSRVMKFSCKPISCYILHCSQSHGYSEFKRPGQLATTCNIVNIFVNPFVKSVLS